MADFMGDQPRRLQGTQGTFIAFAAEIAQSYSKKTAADHSEDAFWAAHPEGRHRFYSGGAT